ncbi:MAG: class I SAM-dependent rRNA methyltransferase [Deinococcales bacterium]
MTVTLAPRGKSRFEAGHPWIYKSDVAVLPRVAGLEPIQDLRGQHLGWALVNPKSEITVRFVSRGVNRPNILQRLERAIEFRRSLEIDGDSFRVVHSDADGLPGLTIDKYGGYLVIQQNCAGLEPMLPDIVRVLRRELEPLGILARFDAKARTLEGLDSKLEILFGAVPDWLEAKESQIVYRVDPWRGQKTGAFLDQRENRAALARFAHGQALDIFSYHASFGLHLAAVCEHVECIDSSEAALERGLENAALNGFDNMTFTQANAFDWLHQCDTANRYQTISLDPPALAKSKKDLDAAYRAYKELNLRCLKLLEPGGILGTASCSFHVSESDFYVMLGDAAADAGRMVRVLERRSQAACHPEVLNFPESRYLKYALLQVM